MSELSLSYSLADQSFRRTKSLGILNLSVNLGDALARSGRVRRFTLFSNSSLASRAQPSNVQVQSFDQAADSGFGRVCWDQWQCYAAAQRTGNDWLFLPKGFASFVRKPPVLLAAYVHDVMHDFYARQFPDAASGLEHWYFGKSFAATLRHADIIFTNTEFTRAELLRVARQRGLNPRRIEVAGIGFAAGRSAVPAARLNRIVLLSSRLPHKRAGIAISWMSRWLEKSRFTGEIHVVGSLPDGIAVPSGAHWHHHLRPSDSEYQTLLSSVRALVYFSEYEGFGMPPVEAVIAGACPVFSDLPPTNEVMRQAGVRFLNHSFDSFSAALDQALTVSPETIERWRQELLARHSWDQVVNRIVTGLCSFDAGGVGLSGGAAPAPATSLNRPPGDLHRRRKTMVGAFFELGRSSAAGAAQGASGGDSIPPFSSDS